MVEQLVEVAKQNNSSLRSKDHSSSQMHKVPLCSKPAVKPYLKTREILQMSQLQYKVSSLESLIVHKEQTQPKLGRM